MTAEISALPESIKASWPYRSRYAKVNGYRMHYIDEGQGDPVVLLHGNPTWGYLYRAFVEPLTNAGYRVIVPDMIGFGLSEKPRREQAHSLDGHIANLTALLRSLDLQRLTVVCHDWGGPTGLGFALSNLPRMHALVESLEPMDDTAVDQDLWHILRWMFAEIGGEWSVETLDATGRLYLIPPAMSS